MMKPKNIVYLAVIFSVCLVVAWVLIQPGTYAIAVDMEPAAPLQAAVGKPAPRLAFDSTDGESLTPSDFEGKVVVINAFASWCGPCRVETPDLVRLYEARKDEVVVIGLNVGEETAAVLAYQKDFVVPYPLVMDPDGELTQLYRSFGLPTSWLIDGDGIVRYIHTGPMTFGFLRGLIDDIQAGREPEPFR